MPHRSVLILTLLSALLGCAHPPAQPCLTGFTVEANGGHAALGSEGPAQHDPWAQTFGGGYVGGSVQLHFDTSTHYCAPKPEDRTAQE